MRAIDLIRNILDFIDQETVKPTINITKVNMPDDDEVPNIGSEEGRRMNQIKDLTPSPCGTTDYANSPDEQYADIEAVTTDAGGGMNEPKHPADIRGEHPSLFSDYLRKLENKE